MVNSNDIQRSLRHTTFFVTAYVVVVVATLVVLASMSATGSDQASSAAWGHAVVVAIFAVLLPMRLRAARRGSDRAIGAIAIIATVLFIVNVVEALLPDGFPRWMRMEMAGIAALMGAIAVSAARDLIRERRA